jgi:hypothetical protein
MTMSYQQSFNTGAEFTYNNGETYKPADQTSATSRLPRCTCFTRNNCKWYVGLGLTEDAPDVSLGYLSH